MSEVDNGVFLAVFKRASNISEDGSPPKGEINWKTLKPDLRRLSNPQLRLVLELIEHMIICNLVWGNNSTPQDRAKLAHVALIHYP